LTELSPFTHTPEVPVDPLALGSPTVIALLAALLVAVGVAGFRRRDVH
jgi:ABC-2 type transport system permease protein